MDFLEAMTKEIFKTFFTGKPLVSAFPDEETKERYFALLAKYLYCDYNQALIDAMKEYPSSRENYSLQDIARLLK